MIEGYYISIIQDIFTQNTSFLGDKFDKLSCGGVKIVRSYFIKG